MIQPLLHLVSKLVSIALISVFFIGPLHADPKKKNKNNKPQTMPTTFADILYGPTSPVTGFEEMLMLNYDGYQLMYGPIVNTKIDKYGDSGKYKDKILDTLSYHDWLRTWQSNSSNTTSSYLANIDGKELVINENIDAGEKWKTLMTFSSADKNLLDISDPRSVQVDLLLPGLNNKEHKSLNISRNFLLLRDTLNNGINRAINEKPWITETRSKVLSIVQLLEKSAEVTQNTMRPVNENKALNNARDKFSKRFHIDPMSSAMHKVDPNLKTQFKKMYNRELFNDEETQTTHILEDNRALDKKFIEELLKKVRLLKIKTFKDYIRSHIPSDQLQLWTWTWTESRDGWNRVKFNVDTHIIDQIEITLPEPDLDPNNYGYEDSMSKIGINGYKHHQFSLIHAPPKSKFRLFDKNKIRDNSWSSEENSLAYEILRKRNLLDPLLSASSYSIHQRIFDTTSTNLYQSYLSQEIIAKTAIRSLLEKIDDLDRIIHTIYYNPKSSYQSRVDNLNDLTDNLNQLNKTIEQDWWRDHFDNYKEHASNKIEKEIFIPTLNVVPMLALLKDIHNNNDIKKRDQVAKEQNRPSMKNLIEEWAKDKDYDREKRLAEVEKNRQRYNKTSGDNSTSQNSQNQSILSEKIKEKVQDLLNSFDSSGKYGYDIHKDQENQEKNPKEFIKFKNISTNEYLRLTQHPDTNSGKYLIKETTLKASEMSTIEIIIPLTANEQWLPIPTLIHKDLVHLNITDAQTGEALPQRAYEIFFQPKDLSFMAKLSPSFSDSTYTISAQFSKKLNKKTQSLLNKIKVDTQILKKDLVPRLQEIGEQFISKDLTNLTQPTIPLEELVKTISFNTYYVPMHQERGSVQHNKSKDTTPLSKHKVYIEKGKFSGRCVNSSHFLNDILRTYPKEHRSFKISSPLVVYSIKPHQKTLTLSSNESLHQVSSIIAGKRRLVIDATGGGTHRALPDRMPFELKKPELPAKPKNKFEEIVQYFKKLFRIKSSELKQYKTAYDQLELEDEFNEAENQEKINKDTAEEIIEQIHHDPNYQRFFDDLIQFNKDTRSYIPSKSRRKSLTKQSPIGLRLHYVAMNTMAYFLFGKEKESTQNRLSELLNYNYKDIKNPNTEIWIKSVIHAANYYREHLSDSFIEKKRLKKNQPELGFELDMVRHTDKLNELLKNPVINLYKDHLPLAIKQDPDYLKAFPKKKPMPKRASKYVDGVFQYSPDSIKYSKDYNRLSCKELFAPNKLIF